MKKLPVIFTIILLVAMTIPSMAASAINQDGYYKGIKLCGRVKVVESFLDDIGEWKFVESGEDFTVQFVLSKIRGRFQ